MRKSGKLSGMMGAGGRVETRKAKRKINHSFRALQESIFNMNRIKMNKNGRRESDKKKAL